MPSQDAYAIFTGRQDLALEAAPESLEYCQC
jgi:hypothetical protein